MVLFPATREDSIMNTFHREALHYRYEVYCRIAEKHGSRVPSFTQWLMATRGGRR